MVQSKLNVRNTPVDNQTVLLRVDFDVPIDQFGNIVDDSRIVESLPTIKHLLERGCKVVIIGHLGRKEKQSSVEQVAVVIARLLDQKIRLIDGIVWDKIVHGVKLAPKNSVIILDNLHSHDGEAINDHDFAKKLVKTTGAKYFVQDSIRDVYHPKASTVAITMHTPSVAGLLLEKVHKHTNYKMPGIESLLDAWA